MIIIIVVQQVAVGGGDHVNETVSIASIVQRAADISGRSYDPELITEETTLMAAGGLDLDSLEVFELITSLEADFGIDLRDVDREELRTVGGVLRAIQSRTT